MFSRRYSVKKMVLLCLVAVLLLVGCSSSEVKMLDGYYTAEAAEFNGHGWKEYITIYVHKNAIITVEYDARNASGFIKSWDMEYMRQMNIADGTYPNKYSREYIEALLSRQDPDKVDAVAGATYSHAAFQLLAKAAIENAKQGDTSVAFIVLPENADG